MLHMYSRSYDSSGLIALSELTLLMFLVHRYY